MHDSNPLDDPTADPFEIAARGRRADRRDDRRRAPRHRPHPRQRLGQGRRPDRRDDRTRSRRPRSSASASPALEGHVGTLRSRAAAERQARARDRRAHPLLRGPRRAPGRALACAPRPRPGATTMILTNGAGGIKEHWKPGTPVLISDHINLTARLAARGRDVHRPHRPLLAAPARPRARHRPRPRRGRVLPVPRTALRDARPRCRWRRPSAATSSACRPRSRRSPPARPAWRSSACR